jgi:hypothetical protein
MTWSLLAILLTPLPVSSEVIDLGQQAESSRVSGVLDFGKPAKTPPPAPELTAESPQPRKSTSGSTSSVVGRADVEAAVAEVALHYVGHKALRKVKMSSVEWHAFFRANIAVESRFRTNALSPVGAIGLGQLMPETAARLGVDPKDPIQNLHGSARYLLAQLARFGSPELALAAYNAGPEAVAKYSGVPPYRETIGHVRKVMAIYHQSLGVDQ